jgi:hypothetical protein
MKLNLKNTIAIATLLAMGFTALPSCQNNSTTEQKQPKATAKKIGILMVNHGSRSETWRNALLALETSVKDAILKSGTISGTKTAFMEYTEPSIATRLKEFDKEGYTDVIIVPVFLTVSTHSFDDIPTIVGQKEDPKSMQTLKVENIERYTPKAQVHIAPLLDFTEALQKNILSRVKVLSKDGPHEALTLIAYGDQTYNMEWTELLNKVGSYVTQQTGIPNYSYGWCGHVAHYSADSTTVAIKRALKPNNKAIVIPVLVAKDEMFQVKIIGDGIAKIPNAKDKVVYMADAILPDKNIENWVISVATEYADKVGKSIAKN